MKYLKSLVIYVVLSISLYGCAKLHKTSRQTPIHRTLVSKLGNDISITYFNNLPDNITSVIAGKESIWLVQTENKFFCYPSHQILRWDPNTARITATISIPDHEISYLPLLSNPKKYPYYQLTTGENSVWFRVGDFLYQIDPKKNKVIAEINLPKNPTGVAVGGGAIWTLSEINGINAISRISLITKRVEATIPLAKETLMGKLQGGRPDIVKSGNVSTDIALQRYIYDIRLVAGENEVFALFDGVLYRIDPKLNKVINSIKLGPSYDMFNKSIYYGGLAVADGAVWISFYNGKFISYRSQSQLIRIDLDTNQITRTASSWKYGDTPFRLSMPTAGKGNVWVTLDRFLHTKGIGRFDQTGKAIEMIFLPQSNLIRVQLTLLKDSLWVLSQSSLFRVDY